jgi:hypothetical protein
LAINTRVPLILSSLLAASGHVGFGRALLYFLSHLDSLLSLTDGSLSDPLALSHEALESRPMNVVVLESASHVLEAPLLR